jgi:hypothetical protein
VRARAQPRSCAVQRWQSGRCEGTAARDATKRAREEECGQRGGTAADQTEGWPGAPQGMRARSGPVQIRVFGCPVHDRRLFLRLCASARLHILQRILLGLRRKVTTLCYPSAMPGMLIRRAPSTPILHSTPAVQWAGM